MKRNTLFVCIFMVMIFIVTKVEASSLPSEDKTSCTHTVYSTNSPSTYHYSYCKICGKCKSRTRHSVNSTSNYRK